MEIYQKTFIDLALQHNALQFGTFTLKSGRVSPYFFNAGVFHTGEALQTIGECYAQAIQQAALSFDVIFGPAYKGIPLACSTAIALRCPFAYNRKESKDHGEGGHLVGASLFQQRILIIDDVITAGTAILEAVDIIHAASGNITAIVVALDRQERGKTNHSALQSLQDTLNVPVISIINLADIIDYAQHTTSFQTYYAALITYQEQYGYRLPT